MPSAGGRGQVVVRQMPGPDSRQADSRARWSSAGGRGQVVVSWRPGPGGRQSDSRARWSSGRGRHRRRQILRVTMAARPWCDTSSSKLVTIFTDFFLQKLLWEQYRRPPRELKDNYLRPWRRLFHERHATFSDSHKKAVSFPSFAHIYFRHLVFLKSLFMYVWSHVFSTVTRRKKKEREMIFVVIAATKKRDK